MYGRVGRTFGQVRRLLDLQDDCLTSLPSSPPTGLVQGVDADVYLSISRLYAESCAASGREAEAAAQLPDPIVQMWVVAASQTHSADLWVSCAPQCSALSMLSSFNFPPALILFSVW